MIDNIQIGFEPIKGDNHYQWVNIDYRNKRVGKARIRKIYSKTIIKTINIFSEFEGIGIAKMLVDYFIDRSRIVVAENVRHTAKTFWEHLDFEDNNDGDYYWENIDYKR